MISILVTAVVSTALGQAPPAADLSPNPLENTINILRADGVPVRDAATGAPVVGAPPSGYGSGSGYGAAGPMHAQAGYGYGSPMYAQGGSYSGGAHQQPAAYCQMPQGQGPGGAGIGVSGSAPYPGCPGFNMCFGTTIGPWPGGAGQQGPYPGAGQQGPYPCSAYEAPAVYAPTKVSQSGLALDVAKERRDMDRKYDDLKERLDKVADLLQQLDKRVAAGEKVTETTAAQVKWLRDELKERFFWHDMDNKLDLRIKPIEESLRRLAVRLEELHPQPAGVQPPSGVLPPAGVPSVQPRTAEARGEGELSHKLDAFQATIGKEITSMALRLQQMEEILKEERDARLKLEDRVRLDEEKGLKTEKPPTEKEAPKGIEVPKETPKEAPKGIDVPKEMPKDAPKGSETPKGIDAPKDGAKDSTNGIPQIGVGRLSRPHSNVPGNRALVVVSLPADAKLYLNNQPTRAQGTVRKFMTPALEPGATFTYVLRAEVVTNGQTRVQTRAITFQAGRQANVTFAPSEVRVAVVK